MSKHSIEITTSAQRQFKKLSQDLQDKILPKLFELEIHPRPFGTKKLADSNFYRIRVGDYRVIYSVDDSMRNIKILDIDEELVGSGGAFRPRDEEMEPEDEEVYLRTEERHLHHRSREDGRGHH